MRKFYRSAKKVEWRVADLSWDELPPVPGFDSERWQLLWSSVVQQQLQADQTAVKAATQLLLSVQDEEAQLYYSTMVQDEARHIEGWSRLSSMLDPVEAHNPYFNELSEMVLECDSVEEQVLVFQVLFEGCALDAFRAIASSTENTILGEMASKLVIDDAIHHRSGVTYEEYLLSKSSKAMYSHLNDVLKKYTPVYCESLLWRPKVRKWLACRMGEHDKQLVLRNQTMINRAVTELGLKAPYDI